MKVKKRQGFSLIALLVFMSILLVIISCNFSVDFISVRDDLTDDEIKNEAYMIDHALSHYARTHAGEYPDRLQYLIDLRLLTYKVEIQNYTYIVSYNNQKYKLSIKLNNNTIYTSPLSTQ